MYVCTLSVHISRLHANIFSIIGLIGGHIFSHLFKTIYTMYIYKANTLTITQPMWLYSKQNYFTWKYIQHNLLNRQP